MNSPEEKARSLVEKFEDIDYCDKHYNDREGLCGHQSKEAALICVDEIMNALENAQRQTESLIYSETEWIEVKDAIQKL